MRSVEQSSKDQTQNVPSAAATQENSSEPVFDVEEIKKRTPKLLRSYVEPLVGYLKAYMDSDKIWRGSVEERFKEIEKTLPETIKKKMTESIQEAQAKQVQALQAAPPPADPGAGAGAGGMETFGRVIEKALGGGSNPMQEEMMKKVWEAGLDSMFAGTTLIKTINQKILSNMGAKIIEDASK